MSHLFSSWKSQELKISEKKSNAEIITNEVWAWALYSPAFVDLSLQYSYKYILVTKMCMNLDKKIYELSWHLRLIRPRSTEMSFFP